MGIRDDADKMGVCVWRSCGHSDSLQCCQRLERRAGNGEARSSRRPVSLLMTSVVVEVPSPPYKGDDRVGGWICGRIRLPCIVQRQATAYPARCQWSREIELMDHGFGGGFDAADFDRVAVDQHGDLRGDDALPMIALINGVIQPFPLFLAVEAADPDVQILLILADEASDNDHAFRHLEGDNLLFHELHPLLALSWSHPILPQFEEHGPLLSSVSVLTLPGNNCAAPAHVHIRPCTYQKGGRGPSQDSSAGWECATLPGTRRSACRHRSLRLRQRIGIPAVCVLGPQPLEMRHDFLREAL